MQDLKTLNDIIPGMKTGTGIFSAITSPMWASAYNAAVLDAFFAANYGHKFATYYAESFEDPDTGIISGANLTALANAIYSMRSKEWAQLYAVVTAEYDPMENTSVTESVSETRNISGTIANTRTLNTSTAVMGSSESSSSANSSSNGSSNTTNTGSNSTDKYGFDSVSAVGDTETSGTATSAVMTTDTATSQAASNASNSQTTADTGTIGDTGNSATAETFTRAYSKHGNIGVMSNVQLLSESTDFYHWSFIRQICEDICQFIALSVY